MARRGPRMGRRRPALAVKSTWFLPCSFGPAALVLCLGVVLPLDGAGSKSRLSETSFRDGALAPDHRCAIAHRGISRFSDVQSHAVVRCFASPRNDGDPTL